MVGLDDEMPYLIEGTVTPPLKVVIHELAGAADLRGGDAIDAECIEDMGNRSSPPDAVGAVIKSIVRFFFTS